MKRRRFLSLSAASLLALALPAVRPPGAPARKRCRVHGKLLKQGRVPITYGEVIDPVEPEAREELFPNSNIRVYGGCVVGAGDPVEVYYCPRCRVAEERYVEAFAGICNRIGRCPQKGWWRKRAA